MYSENHKVRSLVKLSSAEVAEHLAKQSQVGQEMRALRKAAGLPDLSGVLDTAKDMAGEQMSNFTSTMHKNPAIAAALIGSAGGAGLGALTSLRKPKKERNMMGSALTGALAGGAVGGGGYMVAKQIPKWFGNVDKAGPQEQLNVDGKPAKLSPAAIENSSELVNELNELQQRSLPMHAAAGIASAPINYWKNHPILGTIMGADAASHAVGTLHNYLNPGRVSLDPARLHAGLSTALDGNADKALKLLGSLGKDPKSELSEWFNSASRNELQQKLVGMRKGVSSVDVNGRAYTPESLEKLIKTLGDKGTRSINNQRFTGAELKALLNDAGSMDLGGAKISPEKLQDIMHAGGGSVHRAGASAFAKPYERLMKLIKRPVADDPLRFTGFDADGASKPGWIAKAQRASERGLFPKGRFSRMARLGPRAALYGGIPLAQAFMGLNSEDRERSRRIKELLDKLTVPAE